MAGEPEHGDKIIRNMRVGLSIFAAILLVIGLWAYIGPTEPTEKKDYIQACALILGGVAAIATIYYTQRNTRQTLLTTLEVEEQRAQEAALQAYLARMGELMIEHDLRDAKAPENEGVLARDKRALARAQTLSILEGLEDPQRKRIVLQFLLESKLISKEDKIVRLSGADLRKANLKYLQLCGTALNGAILEEADLRETNLKEADLGGAFLSGAVLRQADLSGAELANAFLQRHHDLGLRGADLSHAVLSGATLSGANLSGALLTGADLSGTDLQCNPDRGLKDAILNGADLSGANLRGARVADEQLAMCRSLAGATMPDGSIHE